ncbi:MAG: phenylalanine--tRNA ligase subunit beta [Cytophagales bacterium]|nr:phenylalanine--tRNA ligase subunit beta [Cytophagales bacterium]
MKISHNWLTDFIELDQPASEIADALTQTGLEVEGVETVEKIPGGLRGLVVGEVKTCSQHPNADKLSVTTVDIGGEALSPIVCGAPNVAAGQKVIVAPVNTMIYPASGEPFKIKKAKIRGEASAGMICAEDEVGLGTDHDGIMVLDTDLPNGTPITELFDSGEDTVYEIGLTPNRGDGASHFGAARDLKAFFKRPITFPELKDLKISEDSPITVEVENTDACPRYTGITIRGVKVSPSPDWLQFRLRAIGLTPINNLVDITNYVLHGLGQPLHAFDADKILGGKVIVKMLDQGSKFTTLDEVERSLDASDLMICNAKEGMCIAGVFGGMESGITEETTSVFIESAYFAPDYIRASAQRHGLSTDASFRYERGTDPEITVNALIYATNLILELAGGQVASDIIDIYPNPVPPQTINTNYQKFEWLIGKKIPNDEIDQILADLDIQVKASDGDKMTVEVPAYRSDVTRPADLVEEVLRIHGINSVDIDDSFSADFLAEFNEMEPYKVQEELSYYLAGAGFHEIVTNSLTNPEYQEKLGLGGASVEILNKSSEELGIMKTDPLYTGLEVVRHNINRRQTNLSLFEFVRTYERLEEKFRESEWLTLYLTGGQEESWMYEKAGYYSFHHVVGVVNTLFNKVNIKRVASVPLMENKVFQYGISLQVNNQELAQIGAVKRDILSYYQIDQQVFFAKINWKKLLKLATKKIEFQPMSKYPEVRRDLSLLLNKSTTFSEIREIAFKSEKKLLNRVNVFSVYEGKNIDADKKAYAISFHLQDLERTLTDKQIDKVMNNLMRRFEQDLNAVIRK